MRLRRTIETSLSKLLSVLAFVLTVNACSLTNPSRVPQYTEEALTPAAEFTGRLELRGACLIVVETGGQSRTVIWPSPFTVWDRIGGRITVHGVAASVGDTVSLGGGEVRLVNGRIPESWIIPPAPECSAGTMWLASMIVQVDPAGTN